MDEQSKNNDTFTIRPPEWEWLSESHYTWRPVSIMGYHVYLYLDRWKVIERGRLVPSLYATKEAAMAACEQHWRKEIEPALVRVEDGRDALLVRALDVFRTLMDAHDEDIGMDDFADEESVGAAWVNGASQDLPMTFGMLRRARSIVIEIEQAIAAKEASV